MKYRHEVDGLRAVAILPVVLYHAGISAFSGGFVGVDVFFVISGYLITSIILHERRDGRFSLLGFYQRRVKRIFPALFVMMAVSYPIAFLLLGPGGMAEFSGSLAASVVSLANVYFLGVSGYFATAAEVKPLLHNWSLSVEEQFYLILPALIMLTWRFGARAQALLLALLAGLSLALAQWQVAEGEAARAFFLLPARFWELLVGVLAAYWLSRAAGQSVQASGRLRHLALLGLALIVVAVFGFNADTPFPGVSALLPCAGALLVILFATPQGLAGRVLSLRPVVFVGLVSYSLYLWHYPLLAFTRIATENPGAPLLLAVCALAFLIACLSWRYVERPVREMRQLSARKVFAPALACMVALGAIGVAGEQTGGFRDFYVRHRLDAETRRNYEAYQPDTLRAEPRESDCQFAPKALDAGFDARFAACAARLGKATIVLGDSHAGNIYRALKSAGGDPFLVAIWRGGCRPYKPKPQCPYEAMPDFIATHADAISRVVFQVSGSHYILDHLGKEDSNAAFVPGNDARLDLENLRKTADYVERLAKGPEVIWLGPFAEARVDFENPENFSPERLRFNTVSLALFGKLEQAIRAEVGARTAFRYVSLADVLAFNADSLLAGDCMVFADVDHLSGCGEALYGPRIAAALGPVKP